MPPLWSASSRAPIVGRTALLGAIYVGLLGAVIGLGIGLFVHAPTAPFAAIEVGLPAALAGGLIGSAAGLCLLVARRVRSRNH